MAPQEPTKLDFKAMSAKFTLFKSWTNKAMLDDSSLLFESTLKVFDTKFKVEDSEIWAENGYPGINLLVIHHLKPQHVVFGSSDRCHNTLLSLTQTNSESSLTSAESPSHALK